MAKQKKDSKHQTRTFRADYTKGGHPVTLIATVRYDNECGNGNNSLAITGDLYEQHRHRGEPTTKHASGKTLWLYACGCLHEDIAKHLPHLAPYLKWHLCGSDGPMHYIANTVYCVSDDDLDAARRSAIWPDATDEDLTAPGLEERLKARLPALLAEFRAAVEELGFTF